MHMVDLCLEYSVSRRLPLEALGLNIETNEMNAQLQQEIIPNFIYNCNLQVMKDHACCTVYANMFASTSPL